MAIKESFKRARGFLSEYFLASRTRAEFEKQRRFIREYGLYDECMRYHLDEVRSSENRNLATGLTLPSILECMSAYAAYKGSAFPAAFFLIGAQILRLARYNAANEIISEMKCIRYKVQKLFGNTADEVEQSLETKANGFDEPWWHNEENTFK